MSGIEKAAEQVAQGAQNAVQQVTDKVGELTAGSNAGEAASSTTAAQQTYLDDVTGEHVSKSELKKRKKQREKDDKKAEKAAAAPPKPVKKVSAEENEAELTPNVCQVRHLSMLRNAK
ncbi:lysyl-tRNA synthetase [Cryomyces antarcticus]|nr:lysyl-tRNA synthetase [Cryomyces antarcticus]